MSATSRLPIPVSGPGHSSSALADFLPPGSEMGRRTGPPAFQISGAESPLEYDAGAAPRDPVAVNEASTFRHSLGITGDGMSGREFIDHRLISAARVVQAPSFSCAARKSAPNGARLAVAGSTRAVGRTLRHTHSARVLPAGAKSDDSPPRANVVSSRLQPGESNAIAYGRCTDLPPRWVRLAGSEPCHRRASQLESAWSQRAAARAAVLSITVLWPPSPLPAGPEPQRSRVTGSMPALDQRGLAKALCLVSSILRPPSSIRPSKTRRATAWPRIHRQVRRDQE